MTGLYFVQRKSPLAAKLSGESVGKYVKWRVLAAWRKKALRWQGLVLE
ncbi:hypothetical protein [Vibrio tapetis]|nr:hypothetical protein [Vibrio tapetis]